VKRKNFTSEFPLVMQQAFLTKPLEVSRQNPDFFGSTAEKKFEIDFVLEKNKSENCTSFVE